MVGSVVHGLAGTSPPLRPCRTLAPTGPVLPIVSGAAFLCFAPGLQGSGLYTVTGRASQEKNHSGAAFALVGPKKGRRGGWCDHDYPRWGEHTTESILPPCAPTGFSHKVGAFTRRGSDPLCLLPTGVGRDMC